VDPLVPWGTRCQEPRGVRNQRGSSHPLCSLALPRADREGWGPCKIQRVGPLVNPTATYPPWSGSRGPRGHPVGRVIWGCASKRVTSSSGDGGTPICPFTAAPVREHDDGIGTHREPPGTQDCCRERPAQSHLTTWVVAGTGGQSECDRTYTGIIAQRPRFADLNSIPIRGPGPEPRVAPNEPLSSTSQFLDPAGDRA